MRQRDAWVLIEMSRIRRARESSTAWSVARKRPQQRTPERASSHHGPHCGALILCPADLSRGWTESRSGDYSVSTGESTVKIPSQLAAGREPILDRGPRMSPRRTEGISVADRQGGCLHGRSRLGWNMRILALRMRITPYAVASWCSTRRLNYLDTYLFLPGRPDRSKLHPPRRHLNVERETSACPGIGTCADLPFG